MEAPGYDYALSVTSQFYFCSLPLRLDSYSRCGFGCTYCFSLARGGNFDIRKIRPADPDSLRRRLDRVASGQIGSVLDEFLGHGQPIHFGGMSDPFPPIERKLGIAKQLLRVLATYKYPTVISTKNSLVAEDDYLELLSDGRFMVQFSISSLDDELMRRIDIGTSSPTDRVRALRRLAEAGIPTSCRIQPILPSLERDACEIVPAVAEAGAGHVGAEHLKLPIESSWRGTEMLAAALGASTLDAYKESGRRVGREWVLPIERRIDTILQIRDAVHSRGMTFGAADNDLLPISDGDCCCSGADFVDGFSEYFALNYAEAVRRASSSEHMSFKVLNDTWYPTMTMARFMNSRSRIIEPGGVGGGIREYVKRNWNGSPNGASPLSFRGVQATGVFDGDGFMEYALDGELRGLMSQRLRPATRQAMRARPSTWDVGLAHPAGSSSNSPT
jgi:DNA repair photolyase